MNLDWNQLRVFLAVARCGQFVAASRQLQLDHATVGRRISALEQSLGGKLFERGTTGVSLTPMGQRLILTAEKMESAVLEGLSELAPREGPLSGSVRIGAPDGLGTYYLASRLANFSLQHPELSIELVPLPRTFSLARREADLAITIDQPAEGKLTVMKLTDYSLGAYVSRAHIKKFGPIETHNDLKDRTLITYVQDLVYSPALLYAEELEAASARSFECASVTSQLEAVRAGAGIGILHDYAAGEFDDLVRVLPRFHVLRNYWLVTHVDLRTSRPVSSLHDQIVAEFKKSGHSFFVRNNA